MELAKVPQVQLASTKIKTYNYYIQAFNRWNTENIIDLEKIIEYLTTCEKRYSLSTFNNIKSALKKSLKATLTAEADSLIFLGMLDNAFKEIKSGKIDKKIYNEEVLTEQEIQTLIHNTSQRTGIILETLFKTGLRISELCSLRLEEIQILAGPVTVQIIGKGKKERRILLSKDLFQRIREVFHGKTYLFETRTGKPLSRKYLWSEIHKQGINHLQRAIHPHSFRHSFATAKLKAGKSLKAISNYLGHSTTAITSDMYIHDDLSYDDLF